MANREEIRITIAKNSPCYQTLTAIAERVGYRNLTDAVAMIVSLFGKHLLAWLDGKMPMLATNAMTTSFPASNPAALAEEELEEIPEEPDEFEGFQ